MAAVTTDCLSPEQKAGSEVFLGSRGWGFGVAVAARPSGEAGLPGGFGWDGGFGTSWATDPARELVGIVLTQCLFDSPALPALQRDFWSAAYQAWGG